MAKKGCIASKRGLSLVELMIVVSLLAILAAMVLPVFSNASEDAVVKSTAANFRTLADAVHRYHHLTGQWPADVDSGVKPPELEGYLVSLGFTDSPLGGQWDYDNWDGKGWSTPGGDSVGIAITLWDVGGDTGVHTEVDRVLDDGDLASGSLQAVNSLGRPRLVYILRAEQ